MRITRTKEQIKGEANYVRILEKRIFWFVVGSQHLYGEEALREVKKKLYAQEMVMEQPKWPPVLSVNPPSQELVPR